MSEQEHEGDLETTEQLVQQTAAGDTSALNALFSRHRDRLCRMVEARLDWRLRRRFSADDVLQDVYAEASRRLGEYLREPKVPFFIWVRGLTKQRLVELFRLHLGAQARDARRELQLGCHPAPQAASATLAAKLLGTCTTPSQRAMRAELKFRVQEALEGLDPAERELLILRHFEELTHREIALELGIERSTASKRYFRALAKLRGILEAMPGGAGSTWAGGKP